MNTLPQDPLKLMAQVGALCSDLALHDQALAIFQHLVLLRDDDPNALVSLALARSRSGDESGALQTLQRALAREPGHEMASVMLAIHRHRAGDPAARGLLQTVLDHGRDADALALARSVQAELLAATAGATSGTATAPAGTAARSSRHRYTRLADTPTPLHEGTP